MANKNKWGLYSGRSRPLHNVGPSKNGRADEGKEKMS